MTYRPKIADNGEYTYFCGWTILSKIKDDMKMLENFIKHNKILSLYFSPLPSSSYHITLYNLWCNRSPLLNEQQAVIDNETCGDLKEILEQHSQSYGFFNPKNCMNKLFNDINDLCNANQWSKLTLSINKVIWSGGTIRLSLKRSPEFDQLYKVRNSIINLRNKRDSMKYFHMTLAYNYRDIPKEELNNVVEQLNLLNVLLCDQSITLQNSGLYSFESMTSFQKFLK